MVFGVDNAMFVFASILLCVVWGIVVEGAVAGIWWLQLQASLSNRTELIFTARVVYDLFLCRPQDM